MNQAVNVHTKEVTNQVAPVQPPSMFELIMRAVRDPACDPLKMAQLLDLSRQVQADEAQKAYNASMIDAQAEMDPVRTDANNPQTRSKYATHAALDRAIRPIYSKHGFALSYDTGDGAPPDHMRVLVNVMHREGHTKVHHMDMPADGKGAKGGDVMTKTHAAGSAFSYGKRYLEGGVFNIIVSDAPDDDGNAAGGNGVISPYQMATLQEVIALTNSDAEKVCKFAKVTCLAEITQKLLPRVIEALNSQPKAKK